MFCTEEPAGAGPAAGRRPARRRVLIFFAGPAGQGRVLIFFAPAAGQERVLFFPQGRPARGVY